MKQFSGDFWLWNDFFHPERDYIWVWQPETLRYVTLIQSRIALCFESGLQHGSYIARFLPPPRGWACQDSNWSPWNLSESLLLYSPWRLIKKKFFLSLFGDRQGERERAQVGEGQIEGETESQLVSSPSSQSPMWGSTHRLWHHDLNQDQESDT